MSLAYFPFYPTDFEAKTSHLTLEEDGAYNRLLRLMWMTPGCSLPDDNAWIMRRMRVDMETYHRIVLPLINEFMRRKGGRIYSQRLQEEWQKASESHRRLSEAGKKGGRPKAIENKQKEVKPSLSDDKAWLRNQNQNQNHIREGVPDGPRPLHVDEVSQAVQEYNSAAEKVGWPQCRALSQSRRKTITARLRENGLQGWIDLLDKASASAFLTGENDRGWRADFDWLSKQGNAIKVMEGKYDNRARAAVDPQIERWNRMGRT